MKGGCQVLVTGGSGFIGSHLVEALCAQQTRVRVLVRHTSERTRLTDLGVELLEGDLNDPAALAAAVRDTELVFHVAAATKAHSHSTYERVNAEGTRALVEAIVAAQPRPRRLVYLSSLAAAGPAERGRPVETSDPPRPVTAYGRSKLAGERACLAVKDEVEVIALRAPAVYGPRDRDLFLYFRLAAWGVIPVPAGPERRIQFIHVDDLVDALLRAATIRHAAGIYHVAEPQAYGGNEIATCIASAVGGRARAVSIPRWCVYVAAAASEWQATLRAQATIFNREKAQELLATGWLCETETAKRDLGFEAQIPLSQGFAATASWYRQHGWL